MARRKAFESRRACVRKAPRDHTHVGLCLLYCGTAFRGMQLQTHAPTHHTVEGLLIQALRDVGAVAGIARGRVMGDAHHFARSCRTDRGVHAVRNLVSLFLPDSAFAAVGGCDGLREKLHAALPPTVRVAHVTLLMGNFIPRFCCGRRVYRYFIPAYALLPPCDGWPAMEAQFPNMANVVESLLVQRHCNREGIKILDFEEYKEEEDTEPWVDALAAAVQRGNDLLQRHIVGTHRFHNFSVDAMQRGGSGWHKKMIHPTSNEAVRTVYRCELSPRLFFFPIQTAGPTRSAYEADIRVANAPLQEDGATNTNPAAITSSSSSSHALRGPLPFLVFQIEGSSFLFNMIRKIVGVLLAILRGSRESLLDDALSAERRLVCPLAPGPYLFLFHSSYDKYDRLVRRSGSVRFRAMEDEWRDKVAEEANRFAAEQIAGDVLDVDICAVPALGTLLAARDASRRVCRPHWTEEDIHLDTLKEYHPAKAEPKPTCSEMTAFLRSIRVHNWSIEVLQAANTTAGEGAAKQRQAKRPRAEEETHEEEHMKTMDNPQSNDNEPIHAATEGSAAEAVEDVDDGWLYVASTAEEEREMRLGFQRRRLLMRSRRWENGNATTNKTLQPITEAENEWSDAGSE